MAPTSLLSERKQFLGQKQREQSSAMQRLALQIIAGVDLDELHKTPDCEKKTIRHRLNRLIERERLKGLNGHWSYNLNRHIALKEALNLYG